MAQSDIAIVCHSFLLTHIPYFLLDVLKSPTKINYKYMNDLIGAYVPYKHIDECFMAKCGKKTNDT